MARKKSKNKRKKSKERIPKAIREQTWLKCFGKKYEHKCYISWCDNVISVFDFHVGHDKPESKGGKLSVDNLKPICARCNLSMSNNYTITEWDKLNNTQSSCCGCFKFW
jgi:5-methylcytosine-specific restriction endonuclease McrA